MTSDGTLLTVDGRPTLRFERRFRQPITRVWRAISAPDEMGAWFPSEVVGERAVGAELVFDDEAQRTAAREAGEPTRDDGPPFLGRVVVHDPPRVFSFTWGGELLRFELTPDGDGTVLVFTQVLSHQSVAARNGAGWHACLDALAAALDGPAPDAGEATGGMDDGLAVYHRYVERIGPELGHPDGRGAVTWERASHVDPDRVREATSDPREIAAWGAAEQDRGPLHWDVEPAEHGSTFRLTHDAVGDDAALAAEWHALLVQLDMYLAAGMLVPVDPKTWVDAYRAEL
jgi:uncharacterized protein YndB with AHSA1/START domain